MPEDACKDVEMYQTKETGRKYVCASAIEINNLGEKNTPFITDEGTQAAMTFHACTSMGKFIASVAKIVINGNRVMYASEGSYIESKKSAKRHPLIRNPINGPWYLNANQLPKEMIATLEAGHFLWPGK